MATSSTLVPLASHVTSPRVAVPVHSDPSHVNAATHSPLAQPV